MLVTCEKDHINFLGARVTNIEELKEAIKNVKVSSFLCSSSLDWPEDHTDNPDIIYLCDIIRGNNVSGKNPEFKFIGELDG